jgi:hypothetical protein
LKKFLGFFYIIFIKLLYKIYIIIFNKLPYFFYIQFWVDLILFIQSILIYLCHKILDILEYIPRSKFINILIFLYYFHWKTFFKENIELTYKKIFNFKYKIKYYYDHYFYYYYYYYKRYFKYIYNIYINIKILIYILIDLRKDIYIFFKDIYIIYYDFFC